MRLAWIPILLLIPLSAASAQPGPPSSGVPAAGSRPDADALKARAQNCLASLCPIEVRVDASCNVTVSDFVVNLGGRPPLTRTLRFRITNPNYEFRTVPRAIVGKNTTFFNNLSNDGPFIANVAVNIASPGTLHEYGVNVVRRQDGVACPQLDPWMVE